MASGNIQGITISIGGDTVGLQQAISNVSTETKALQTELRAVERGLKFDPGNVELVRQRQELLTQSIDDTSRRLEVLRNAQAQVQRQYDSGEIPVEQYRAFQRELQVTEGNLNRLQGSFLAIDAEQERLGRSTRALGTFFEATGQDVEQFASVLGTRLTQAIRDGTASADQIERALRLMGREALGAGGDIDRLRASLESVDGGGNLQSVRRELSRVESAADGAESAASGLKSELSSIGTIGAGAAAGIGALVIGSNELNVSLARLRTNATIAGNDLGLVEAAFQQVAAVSGETDSAVEAVSNILASGFSDSELEQVFNGINGAAIRFSDTLKTEGIADGIQETLASGEAIGPFAELLERSGVNVKAFNKELAEAGKQGEETDFILRTFAELGLNDVYSTYQELNPEVTANAEATANLQLALANLSLILTPLVVLVTELVTSFVELATANPELVTNLAILVGSLAGITAVFAALAPIVSVITNLWPLLATAVGSVTLPIALTVAAIVGLGAAFIALYQNSETFRENLSTVFEAIRGIAIDVFGAIATFIGERIQQILQFWATDGAQILSAVENVFNGIMAVVQFVMPAVQLIVDTVWKAIQNIISGALNVILGLVKVFSGVFNGDFSKIWEGIQQIFVGAIDLILGLMSISFLGGIRTIVTNLFKGLITLVRGSWTSITGLFSSGISGITSFVNGFRTTITTQFNNIKTAILGSVRSIDLKQVGIDVIRGLATGINNAKDIVYDAIKSVVGNVVSFAKKLLGIRSPSRVFMEIGKFTGQGMAIGISGTKSMNEKAIGEINTVIRKSAESNAKEVTAIAKKAEEERTKIQKTFADKRDKAQTSFSNSTAKKAVTSAKQTAKTLEAANKNYSDKVIKASKTKSTALAKINSDEAAALKKINDKADADMLKKGLEVNKLTLDNIRNFIKNKKDLNEISLIDEANYYRTAYRAATTNSAENKALLLDYQNTVKTINDSITTINEGFLTRSQTINDNLIKGEEDLNNKYKSTLDSRYQTLVSAYGLFEEVASQDLVDPQILVQNLDAQVNALQRFQNSIATFRGRGISGALLEDLQDLGPKANAQLESLNRLTDAELQRYQETYETRSRIARETATRELEPLAADTQAQIQVLRATANTELEALNVEWQAQINKVVTGTDTQFKTLNQVGKNAAQGLLTGLSSVQPALMDKAKEIANGISKTIQDALQIKSPSRVTMGFGINIGQGLINGMDETIRRVQQSSTRLSDAVINAQGSLNGSVGQSNANQIANQQIINQSNNIDLNSLVAAIASLASRPIETSVQLNGQTIANSVSGFQYNNANIAALTRGVQL